MYEYTYDANENITQCIGYEWNKVTNQWETEEKNEYTYNNSYTFSELIIPDLREYYIDDLSIFKHMMFLINHYTWDEASNDWNFFFKIELFYSEQNIGSVNDQSIIKAKIYPNPASEYITFSFSENFNQITFELFDSQGRMVNFKEISNNEILILDGLNNGIYFYNLITTDGKKQSGKLIKQ
jgi:hypothetical protein